MSEGIRSGVNWMRLKRQVQRVGQRVDHQRLGQAGHADQQAVAAGEDRDQQLLEHRVLADDHLAHLGLEPGERVLETLHGGQVVGLHRLARIRVGVAHAETSVVVAVYGPRRCPGRRARHLG